MTQHAQPPYPAPPGGWAPGPPPPQPPQTLAIVALVLGIVAWVGAWLLASVPGAVVGFLALRRIRRGEESGRGLALAGFWLSVAQIVLTVLLGGVLLAGLLIVRAGDPVTVEGGLLEESTVEEGTGETYDVLGDDVRFAGGDLAPAVHAQLEAHGRAVGDVYCAEVTERVAAGVAVQCGGLVDGTASDVLVLFSDELGFFTTDVAPRQG